MSKGLWIVAIVGAVGYLFALALDSHLGTALAKPIPVTAMIILAARKPASGYRNALLAGLVFSLVGDVFLVHKTDMFLFGLIYFLIAHLCYLAAFLGIERKVGASLSVPFLVWVAAAFWFLQPYLGELLIPVIVYMSAICIMMWRACVLIGSYRPGRQAAAGAVIFGLSDTVLAVNHFATPFDAAPFIVITLYWTGQALLTASIEG